MNRNLLLPQTRADLHKPVQMPGAEMRETDSNRPQT